MKINPAVQHNFGKIITSRKMNNILSKEFEETKMQDEVRDFWEYKITMADHSTKYDIHVDNDGKASVVLRTSPGKKVSTHYCATPLESLFSAIQSITKYQ